MTVTSRTTSWASMNVTLRPATDPDAPRVANVLIDTRTRFMPYAPSAHTDEEVREWVVSYLVPTSRVTVAEVEGHVMGVMATEVGDQVSWVTQMAVDPTIVGHGLGSLLLARAVGTLVSPIRLYTFQANVGARRFYERHGFVAIEFTDGQTNEEHCPDILYEYRVLQDEAHSLGQADVATARGSPQTLNRQ